MNNQKLNDDIQIADYLLKQLEDQYMAVLGHNITMPKQNILPEEDPQNPYQPLQFDEQDQNQSFDLDFELSKHEESQQTGINEEPKPQQSVQAVLEEIQKMQISQTESNPQIKQLMEVQPTSQQIYTNLPHKDFQIDQKKIKSFALSMNIDEPEWLKDENLCKVRISQLFTKKPAKPFTKT